MSAQRWYAYVSGNRVVTVDCHYRKVLRRVAAWRTRPPGEAGQRASGMENLDIWRKAK